MKTLIKKVFQWTAVVLFGFSVGMVPKAQAVEAANCRNRPIVKNLMALTTASCEVRMAVPQELTGKEAKRLAATAESAEDHWKVARYYTSAADRLDARGAGYEAAAVAFRNGPIVKNLAAPNTAARYEYFTKEFREEARSDRELAAAHERMARGDRAAR